MRCFAISAIAVLTLFCYRIDGQNQVHNGRREEREATGKRASNDSFIVLRKPMKVYGGQRPAEMKRKANGFHILDNEGRFILHYRKGD